MEDKVMSGNSGPGYEKHPQHRITTKPAGVRVRIVLRGEVIADTRDAVELRESSYPVVYYLPREDVMMHRLVRSDRETYCPFKGQASYFSVVGGPADAVWSYEQPYDEVAVIRERLAFYPDKVDSIDVSSS